MDFLGIKHHTILFAFGILGIISYVVLPILFPHVPNIRQPELLPVYTLMLGLGQLLKGNDKTDKPEGGPTDEKKT